MISLSDINTAYKNGTPEERNEFIELILFDLIKNPGFQNDFNNKLILSPLKPIKRIAELETVTGLNDFADFEDEEREPNIPEKIEALKEEIQNIEYKAPVMPTVEFNPSTKKGTRALHLIKKLRESKKDHFDHKQIEAVLTDDSLNENKIHLTCKNPRKAIIDVLKEAASICSDVVLDKQKNGHKTWRMVLKS